MKTLQVRNNLVAAWRRGLLAFCSAAAVLIGASAQAQPCDLYPIALSAQTLSNVAPNTVINDIFNGTQAGHFGWLTWGGSPSEPTLVTSLTPPGNSSTYVNPDNTSDRQVSVGDWVTGKPGVSNSKNVREALDVLKAVDVTVPVWDQTRGQGATAAYRVSAFARVRLLSYHLPGQNRISARFLGYTSCSAQNVAPVVNAGPDLTNTLHTLPATLTLNGSVADDGLPIGGTLIVEWSQLSGPGTVTFSDSNAPVTTATFELDGTYVLQLFASDSQLSTNDTVTVTINRDNQPPVAHSINVVADEDVPLHITLLGTDPEGDPLEYPIVIQPSFGNLTGSGSNVVYTPKPDYNGPDEFTFRVFDGFLESSNAVVMITVRPINDPPVADSNSVTNNEDVTFPIALSGSDIEGSALTFTILAGPTNGTLQTTSSNVVFYTPSSNFFGQDSFTFQVNDGELDSLPATNVIVIASVNDAPIVDAGPDDLISQPADTVTLQGTVTDDEFPTAMADVIEWSFISGPGTVTFGDSNQPVTTATFSATGIYVLRLTAHDSLLTNSDEVTITVNALPLVNAGTDFTNTLPAIVTLNGSATDDGLPPNAVLTVLWEKVSGPGTVLFASPVATNTTVEFGASGIYVLSLTASDSVASASDHVTLTINRAPIVDAGSDQTNSTLRVQLHGTMIDDGVPTGVSATSLWAKASGPGEVMFDDPTAPGTFASFSEPGIYVLQLFASDMLASSSNEVRIVINGVPVVNAGADQRINFPGSISLNAAATDDGLPEGSTLAYQWSQIAGPGTVTFSAATSTGTSASFDQPGVYTLAFSADDSLTNATDELIVIVNDSPSVSAGANQLIAFGETASLNGSVTDDALPTGITNSVWSKFSGPGNVVFGSAASPVTTVTFNQSGVYVLHLTVDDTMATNTAAVTITVNATPVIAVSASNATVRIPTPAHLLAAVSDDGLPVGVLNGEWTQVSGPGTVTFGNANATNTAASFSQAGNYVLRFTVNDTVATNSAEVMITVLPANILPVAELLSCNERVFAAGETIVLGADAYDVDGQVVQVEFVRDGVALGTVTNEPYVFEWANAPAGVHTVSVIATDDLGGTVTSAPLAISVSTPPIIALSSAGGLLFSPGAPVTLAADATDADGSVAKVEFFDGPTKLGEDVSAPFAFVWSDAAPGIHVVTARATDDLGLSTVSTPLTLKVNEAPLVLITAPMASGVVAGDQPVVLVAAAADHDGSVVKVEFFIGTQSVGESLASPYRLEWSPPAAGDYTVTAIATDSDGATATNQIAFHVNAAPVVAINQPSASAVFQLGEPVEIQVSANDSDGSIQRIEYLENSTKLCSDTLTSTTLTLQNVAPGQHTYLVRAVDDAGADSVAATVTITVNNPPFVRIDSPAHGTVYTNVGDVTLVATAGDADGSITKVEFYEGSTLLGEGTAQGGTFSLVWSNVPAGSHQVTAKAYDNQSGLASASISVSVNSAPIVDAGPDQTITLPAQVVLQGTVIDDGLLAGRLTTTWTQISGPGTITFPCVCSVLATGAFSAPGVYVLRLTADDGLVSTSDDITVIVNRRPIVHAGFDQTVTLPSIAQLKGTWIDDGMPPGATVTSIWTKISGTGTVTFLDATVTNTTASFSKPGPYEPPVTYVLRLTVSDTLTNVTDDVSITVNPVNQAPIVNAGADQIIASGSKFLVRGEVTDDGWPVGVTTSRWTQVSGPGTARFGNPLARVTTVTFSASGTYVLRLMAGDTELVAADEVTIAVDESNRAPVVNVGPGRSLVLPNALQLSATVQDDGLPAGTVSVTWSLVSGPATVTFDNANSASTSAHFTSNGVYVLQLAASDSELTTTAQLTVSVVPGTNQPPLVDAGPDRVIVQPLDATGANRGKIFVIDDEISLSNDGQSQVNPIRFATNLAKWFTGGTTGKFLAYSAHSGLNGNLLARAMTNAGHSWTVSTGVTFTVSNLLQYNAVYLAGTPADNHVLIDYVRAGGNAYLAGGTALGGAVAESARWSTFLNEFGFNYKDSYNSLFGFVTINSKDPIFAGVTSLWHREGNYVQELLPSSPITDLLDTFQGEGLFGVYHNPYPEVVLQGSVVDDGQPPGSSVALAWAKVSGPGTVVFTSTNSARTTATFSEAGTYILRLTASNANVTAADDVTVTVECNEPPTVNAGPNLITTVWDAITLPGSVSDDGFPAGAALEYGWAKISGPGTVTFGNAAPVTTARFSMAGTYVLRLTAGDSQTFAGDNVTVTVINSTNTPPSVIAGTLTSRVNWPSNALVTGIVSDDGFPVGQPLTFNWSKASGPGEVRFADATTTNTSVSFSTNGVYSLRLTVNDSQLSAFSDVQIIVDAPANQFPVINAGPDQRINTLSTTLAGTVTDDGFPATRSLTSFWSRVSGPGTATFANSNSPVTTVFFSRPGTYSLRLTVTDGLFTQLDDVSIIMTNQFPWVNAGPDRAIALPQTNLTLNGIVLDDAFSSTNLFPTWSRISGPGNVSWGGSYSANSFPLIVTPGFTNAGTYILRLSVHDGSLTSTDDVQVVVGPATNQPPAVNAGADETVTLVSGGVPLGGVVSDDGVPMNITNISWSLVQGPAAVTFENSNAAATTVSFDALGKYVFRLTANDTVLTNGDEVIFTVTPPVNLPPVADAGPDLTIHLFEIATLNGTITDDDLPEGGLRTAVWRKISGPDRVTFSNPVSVGVSTAAVTTASFSATGTYVLRLFVDDGATNHFDDVVVTVLPDNLAPLVNAGLDQTVVLPRFAVLNGEVSDDGVPASFLLETAWSKVSGPGTVSFYDPNAPETMASFSIHGTYVLRLTATDSQFTGTDELTVIVRTNGPPIVNAGPDRTNSMNNTIVLGGSGTEDGLPSGFLVFQWSKVNGPGLVTFANPALTNTAVSFSSTGTYVLRLTAMDLQSVVSDTVVLTITAATNRPPIVAAGADQTVVLPNTASLAGTVGDDGLPGGVLSAVWSQVNGPGTVSFLPGLAPTLAQASFTTPGVYVLRLTASDSAASSSDELTVNVYPEGSTNQAPVVDAGADQRSIFPNAVILNGTANDDGLPGSALVYTWNKVSGPGTVTFSNANTLATSVTFSDPGTYVLELTVSDSALTGFDQVTVRTETDPGTFPTVEIVRPEDGLAITAPSNVIGTVQSPILQSYQLQYRFKTPDDSGVWITLATGTDEVSAGVVGKLDPTLLLNGIYELQLSATDLAGRTGITEPTTVVVDRNMKVGNFTISFNDLTVPVAGIPIQVIRTYDSRDKRVGDFGVGWNLDIKNIRLQKNRNLGSAWEQTFQSGGLGQYCLIPRRPRVVTITFPDGKTQKFEARSSPECQIFAPIPEATVTWQPQANTRGTLVAEGADADTVTTEGQIGITELFDQVTLATYNPTLFRYTSDEGDVYIIDERDGLKQMTDRNGNRLTVETNGITWTNVVTGGPGKSVAFQRDDLGRITNILDAAGHALTYRYDANGNLVEFVDRVSLTNTFSYNTKHELLTLIDARGIPVSRNEYDDAGRLIAQVDAAGNTNTFIHDLDARAEIIRDRLGNITVHEYDENGNITRSIDALMNVTSMTYDANDNMLTKVDALGNTNRFTYDARDNKLTETDPLGNTTSYTYNAFNRPTSIRNARGFTTTNIYDASGNLRFQTNALGHATQYTYDAQGNLLLRTDALGNTLHKLYDQFGHLTNIVVRDVNLGVLNTTTVAYDANGNQTNRTTWRTTPSGVEALVTRYVYDSANRLVLTVHPDGATNATIYNAISKPATNIDALGRQTVMQYDDRGNLTRTTYPDSTFEETFYDAENRRVGVQDKAGRITGYTNDALGRLVITIHPDNTGTTNFHDAMGRVFAMSDARGNTTFYGYDAVGRRTSVTNALLQVSRSVYDEAGNLVQAIDALGHTNTFVYDELNRRRTVLFPDGTGQTTTYDALARRVAETDQSFNTTVFGYDALGRLTAVTNALGHVTRYEYNEQGQQTAQIDAESRTTRFEYDALGRRTKRTLPLNQYETYAYDLAGRMTNSTDFNGRITTFIHDTMNRLVAKVPDATFSAPAIQFGYNELGLRTNMVDASGTTRYQYDTRNRLIAKVTPQGTLTYSYNANGQVTNITSLNTNGARLSYSYDALNRLSEVNDPHAGSTTYTYDTNGNLRGFTYPNGVNHFYQYNALNRLTNLNVSAGLTPIANYAYTLAPSGHRTAATETLQSNPLAMPTTLTRLYSYDRTYRLTNETIGGTSYATPTTLDYGYDKVGNRLQLQSTQPGIVSAVSTYDANDRLNTSAAEQFDNNGNTLFASGFAMTQADKYDFENRLVQRIESGKTVTIVYDGDGNRAKKIVTTSTNTVTTWFLVDTVNLTGYAQVLDEITTDTSNPQLSTPQVTRIYSYGHDLISQQQFVGSGWELHFFGCDGHNNTRFLTDVNGNVTDSYDYDAFGNLIARTGSTANNYLFTGEQYDPDLGLYFLRARYQNTHTGRFWTMDQFEGFDYDPGTLHKYLFVANNPIMGTDPSGRLTLSQKIAVVVAVALLLATPPLYKWRMRSLVDANDEYARTTTGTPFTVYGSNYYALTPAGRAIVREHEKVHQSQGFFMNFKGRAEVELPAYKRDIKFAQLLLATQRLTPEEIVEVENMIRESEAMIKEFEAELNSGK